MHKKLHKNLHKKRDLKKIPKKPFSNLSNQENITKPKIELKNIDKFNFFSVRSIAIIVIFSLSIFGITQFQNSNDNNINFEENNNGTDLKVVSNTTTSTTSTTLTIQTSTSTSTIPITVNINNIEDAQKQLLNLGLYKGDINGFNNSLTRNAIKEFQKLAGLVVDGILGPNTKAALEIGENSYVSLDSKVAKIVDTIVYSAEIEEAQKKLKELNLYSGDIDGINGKLTKNAIREFQRLSGLSVDGVYGPITKASLEKGKDSYIEVQNTELTTTTTIPLQTSYASIGRVPTQNYTDGVNSPVNGLIMPDTSNNSIVIGVKNDNNVRARPQSGPQYADAVVEVLVEGGMTRFINIFYQSDTSYHGPIRSARPTDPTVLKPLGGVLVVSGATGGLIPQIEAMGVPVITDRRPEFFRISSRKAPHNLYADTIELKEHALSRGYKKFDVPQPLFPWGDPNLNEWSNNNYLILPFSGYTRTTWTWDGNNYKRTYYDAYKNKNSDNIHNTIDLNGNTNQISAETIIALFCEPYLHPLQLPSVKTVGEGRAIIAHGGKLIDVKWKRGSNDDPFHILDNNNNILYVPKGKVWISLVPNTNNPSFG